MISGVHFKPRSALRRDRPGDGGGPSLSACHASPRPRRQQRHPAPEARGWPVASVSSAVAPPGKSGGGGGRGLPVASAFREGGRFTGAIPLSGDIFCNHLRFTEWISYSKEAWKPTRYAMFLAVTEYDISEAVSLGCV